MTLFKACYEFHYKKNLILIKSDKLHTGNNLKVIKDSIKDAK